MYTSTYNSLSGYEPTPGARQNDHHKRPRISDAQLKILPAFDYAGKQLAFADSLRSLIMTWRLDFLVKNQPWSDPGKGQHAARSTASLAPTNTFYSPREDRRRAGTDLLPDPGGMSRSMYGNGSLPVYSCPPPGEYHSPPPGEYHFPPSGEYQQDRLHQRLPACTTLAGRTQPVEPRSSASISTTCGTAIT